MGISKIEFGEETLIDLTNDTVKPKNLLKGETAHGSDGELVEGSFVAVPTTTSLAVTEEAVSALDGTVGKMLNDKFGGCSFEQEGNDFYIVGADSVRKKLGDESSVSKKYKISGFLNIYMTDNSLIKKGSFSFIHENTNVSGLNAPQVGAYSSSALVGARAYVSNISITEIT